MTEEEAKTKWCHQTKRDVETSDHLGTIRCIGSGCMAWRWATAMTEGCKADPKRMKEAVGYCGLAGTP